MFQLPDGMDLDVIIASFPGLLYIKDLSGTYIGCNPEFLEFMYNAEFIASPTYDAVIGKTDFDFFGAEQAAILTENDNRVIDSGDLLLFEELVIDPSGEFYTHISNKRPLRDKVGEIRGVICTSISITLQCNQMLEAQRSMQNFIELKYLTAQMDKIISRMPEHFYWMDLECRVILCNESQAKLFGLAREEFVGMTVFDLAEHMGWDQDVAYRIQQHNLQVLKEQKSLVTEEHFYLQGQSKTFLTYKNPFFDKSGRLIGLFGVSVDITELKKMEIQLREERKKAEVASRAKTDFLMNISHNLRTPFSGIIGNAELLLLKETDPDKKQKLQQMIDSSTSLLSLLNDIIDVVQLDGQHQIKPRIAMMDIRQSIDKIATIMQIEAFQKHLDLQVRVDERVPQLLMGDARSIERILLNLVGNALKFTHQGGVKIIANARPVSKKTITLELTVQDTGIGIAEDKVDSVFEQFRRLHSDFKQSYEGTGLGLWIVKELANLLGGEIKIHSEVDVGTRITVEIDCDLIEGIPKSSEKNQPKIFALSLNKKVLIVEDEPIASKIAGSLIHESFHVDVDFAKDGETALKMAGEKEYHFILMDVGLPDINGIKVARRISSMPGLNQYTPIIGLTAHAELEVESAVMADVLAKPLTHEKCQTIGLIISTAAAANQSKNR